MAGIRAIDDVRSWRLCSWITSTDSDSDSIRDCVVTGWVVSGSCGVGFCRRCRMFDSRLLMCSKGAEIV